MNEEIEFESGPGSDVSRAWTSVTDERAVHLRASSDPTLRWFVPTWKWEVRLTWTNWTFGVYWGKIGRKYMIGIDIGPLEIVRVRAFVRSTRSKHRTRT